MKRRVRILALVALALGPAACGRSCGCVEGEKTYEHLDGKVKVELVRKVHWSGGRIPGPITNFVLRVHTTPEIDHPIHCDHVDMAEDDAGKNVGYRCKGTDVWDVLRLRGADRYIYECKAPVGTGKKPSFDKLEALSRSADRVIGCISSYENAHPRWAELARSIEEDEGATAATQFLVRTSARPIVSGDPWDATLLSRSDGVRSGVLASLCPSVERADASMPQYARAAAFCRLDGPNVAAAAVGQLEALLKRPVVLPSSYGGGGEDVDAGRVVLTDGGPGDQGDALALSHRMALEWAAVIAVTKAPVAAGHAACAAAPAAVEGGEHYGAGVSPRRTALAVLAATKTKCDAARAWLATPPCGADLDCEGVLCPSTEVLPKLQAWAAQGAQPLDGGSRPSVTDPPPSRMTLLAFAYSQGPLDREITIRNARRHYEWADAGDVPSCADQDAGNGTPCRCDSTTVEWTLCGTPAATTRTRYEACSFHIDDAKKRLDDVRRVCHGLDESCLADHICCGGLECKYDADGGPPFCRKLPPPSPPRDAAPR